MKTRQHIFRAMNVVFLLSAIQLFISVPLFGGSAYTPSKDSVERKAILNALRQRVEKEPSLKVIFMVNYLKVSNGWAWIETSPQSPDGKSHYEDISALMRLNKKDSCWEVAELACTEVDNPDCLGAPNFFQRLMSRFPEAPADIFPH